MMPSFRVDSVKDIKGLACYLEKRFEKNARNPFRFQIIQSENYLIINLEGCIRENGRKYLSALNNLSDILAEYILKSYENMILEKIINRVCDGISKTDKDEIYRIVCSRLYAQQCENGFGNRVELRRLMISSKISEFLRNTHTLILEGFVTFRLGEYVKRLEIEVERSVRQFFVEKQYEEYIQLLTAFVRMQVPKVPELHVFVLENGWYKVEGHSPFEIPEDVIEGFGIKESNPVIEDDDFMIGFLLTCAPVKIFIHNAASFRNKELLNTIRIVFSECVLIN
jgi:putative sporulation protein YtxC